MKPIDVPKAVVLIVVCTAAFLVIAGALSLEIAMLCKIDVEEVLLLSVIQVTAGAGGLLAGLLVKTKPESEPKP
jgi:hypothetical protein